MAADTANQKVFVPLAGVLKLQDEVRRLEETVEHSKAIATAAQTEVNARARAQHRVLASAIEVLGLPIEVRRFN